MDVARRIARRSHAGICKHPYDIAAGAPKLQQDSRAQLNLERIYPENGWRL